MNNCSSVFLSLTRVIRNGAKTPCISHLRNTFETHMGLCMHEFKTFQKGNVNIFMFTKIFGLMTPQWNVQLFRAICSSYFVDISLKCLPVLKYFYYRNYFTPLTDFCECSSCFKRESTWGPCRQVYSAHHRFPWNLAHLYNITSTLTIWNRLVQLSIVYEIYQSNYKIMKMLKFEVKIYIKFDHLLQARNNEKWHDIST